MNQIRHILEMIRFSHTVFAMPFALLAGVMAWTADTPNGQRPDVGWAAVVGVIWCIVCARSAAMAFNRLADREIDAANPRTENRHLPQGILSAKTVWVFTIACSVGFVLGTLLFLPNRLPLILSVPVLGFLFGYSFTKRFTQLAHFWLGAALMLAPICTWIAFRGELVLSQPADLVPAVLLGLAVLLWVSGFDIIYACQDAQFDRDRGLSSVPVKLGIPGALRTAAICHFLMILVLCTLPWCAQQAGVALSLGWIYWTAVAAVAVLLIYEHALVRPEDLTRVNVAFFQVNAIISLGLFIAVSVDLLWS